MMMVMVVLMLMIIMMMMMMVEIKRELMMNDESWVGLTTARDRKESRGTHGMPIALDGHLDQLLALLPPSFFCTGQGRWGLPRPAWPH